MAEEKKCRVYLDGRELGVVADGNAFAEEIRANRRRGLLSGEINVSYRKSINEVHLNAVVYRPCMTWMRKRRKTYTLR
ncbi:hypothetical protein M1373_02950 [Candidatus Marsarchaeota archaeon]|nr:hypothetical protein [Candidatus Marsarchaeota archaeon]